MCVILVCDTERPTDEMIERAYEKNPQKAGFAWREDVPGVGVVARWEKGLDLKESLKIYKTLPLPFIAHFRIASQGFSTHETLNHPFPIQKDVPLTTSGKTKGALLFHNGYWANWKNGVLDSLKGTTYKIPPGRWSDTRAMAWMAAHYGIGVLNFIDEKAVAFGPRQLDVFGMGWSKIGEVWVSNRFFENGGTRATMFPHQQQPTTPTIIYPPGRGTSSETGEGLARTTRTTDSARTATVLDITTSRDAADGMGPGGASTVIPFAQACLLNKIGQLSKNQLKRARKATEQKRPFTMKRDKHGNLQVVVL